MIYLKAESLCGRPVMIICNLFGFHGFIIIKKNSFSHVDQQFAFKIFIICQVV